MLKIKESVFHDQHQGAFARPGAECQLTLPAAQGGHVRGSSRPPTSSAVLNSWKELFCEFTRVGAGEGSTPTAIRQVFGEAGHTTKTT